MTRLYEALDDIAAEAPLVHLVDQVIAGHRRRRRAGLTVAAAVVVMLGVATTAVVLPVSYENETAASQRARTVPDLPDGRVGPLSHAYLKACPVYRERGEQSVGCDVAEWRVVTGTGTTYRVPQALARIDGRWLIPVSISRDGRMLAYYSRRAQTYVVRDLVSGSEVVSPVTVKEQRINENSSFLVVSDDGRYVSFVMRADNVLPGTLIDMRTGRTVSIPGVFKPISIKNGVAVLSRNSQKGGLWRMPVTGGGKVVDPDGKFYMHSELAPDGRTVAAFEDDDDKNHTLTLLDIGTGRILRKFTVRGLPKDGRITGTSLWRNGSEVTVLHRHEGISTYAVDVETGQARRLVRYPALPVLILPGTRGPL